MPGSGAGGGGGSGLTPSHYQATMAMAAAVGACSASAASPSSMALSYSGSMLPGAYARSPSALTGSPGLQGQSHASQPSPQTQHGIGGSTFNYPIFDAAFTINPRDVSLGQGSMIPTQTYPVAASANSSPSIHRPPTGMGLSPRGPTGSYGSEGAPGPHMSLDLSRLQSPSPGGTHAPSAQAQQAMQPLQAPPHLVIVIRRGVLTGPQ